MWARVPATHTYTLRHCVNGDARLTKRVYMSMYARVHIQSTSRMCFTGILIISFFFLFYNTQNFVTARIIGRKCNRDEQASVITVMPYRVPPRKSVIFVSQTHLFFFYSYTFTYIYIYTSTSFFRFRSSSIYVYISPLGYTLPPIFCNLINPRILTI